MKETFIKTENYTKMQELMSTLVDDLKGNEFVIGLAYGDFGLGKTITLEKIRDEYGAIFLRQTQSWTPSSVRTLLAEHLIIDTKGKNPIVVQDEIVNELLSDPRPIIIDEIDGLLNADRFSVLEFFRDIHDLTGNPLILVGMEGSKARLKNHRHFFSRIAEECKFMKIGMADIRSFCSLGDIEIEEDLIVYFSKKYPNFRRMKVLILRMEKWADINGVEKMGLKLFKQSNVEKHDGTNH